MSWRAEFGTEWKVPAKIDRMVASGEMVDNSWHNDAMPMFGPPGVDVSVNSIILAVDHVDPKMREYIAPRFHVSVGERVLYFGNILAGAIAVWRAARWLFHGGPRRPRQVACGGELCERAKVPFDIAVANAEDPAFCGTQTANGDWVVRVPSGGAPESFEIDGHEYVVLPSR